MATTPMGDSPHLNLKPMWTPHFDFGVLPTGSPLKPNRGHIYSPSPRSPKTLPTPVLPSVSYDGVMRQHERSLVERLDQRIRQTRDGSEVSPVGSTSNSRPISPVEPDQNNQKRLPSLFIPSARNLLQHPPTPASPASTFPRRQTLVSETRSMLLAGVDGDSDRRQSVAINRPPVDASKIHHEQLKLRAWGDIYFGDIKSADVLVQAVSLRRPSDISSASSEASNSAASSPLVYQKHLVVRARVRPRNPQRKNFLIQREFDIDQLRATIPDPLPTGFVPQSPATGRAPTLQVQRGSPLVQEHRRASMVRHVMSPVINNHRRGSLQVGNGHRRVSTIDTHALMRGNKAMPIHLEYARTSVPVLAALMVSGHIREGDSIDLPLPHPEAWPATVAYIYSGHDEMTHAVKENILYLGGKLPIV
ncbi:hypothetical protein F5X68DRAFT_250879 [Plectosphaerella plurivora]|uniref:Uncharacterized protein n=1 Tax=Plectosphaerella plurivora TaxID=936078 RepID=A0A9P8VJF3_9PEZI|nr:hypothetical protein F5X68DRAFT_250879 [Plectosphaerella plurivora]